MDFEHFILNFRALRSNHEPNLDPPVERVLKVFDFCRTLISMLSYSSYDEGLVYQELALFGLILDHAVQLPTAVCLHFFE